MVLVFKEPNRSGHGEKSSGCWSQSQNILMPITGTCKFRLHSTGTNFNSCRSHSTFRCIVLSA